MQTKRILSTCLACALSLFMQSTPLMAHSIFGAGATFPNPIYDPLFQEYFHSNSVSVHYLPVGSGAGFSQFKDENLDFAATDMMLSETLESRLPAPVIHIPTYIGAVSIPFNLPGIKTINLSADVIANIYLGKINKWNHPDIKAINLDKELPDLYIIPINRSGGSGTTYIFTDYLTQASNIWSTSQGRRGRFELPHGISGSSNKEVSYLIKQIPGSIGYVEYVQANKSKLNTAAIENIKKSFIQPSKQSILASADNIEASDSTKIALVNSDNLDAYPITSLTWLLVYKEQSYNGRDKNQGYELKKLIWWMTHEGQRYIEGLGLGKLPKNILKATERNIKQLTFEGKSI